MSLRDKMLAVIDDVNGSVSAGANVSCDDVGGDVRANSVHCEEVSGGVFRMN